METSSAVVNSAHEILPGVFVPISAELCRYAAPALCQFEADFAFPFLFPDPLTLAVSRRSFLMDPSPEKLSFPPDGLSFKVAFDARR
jgi:hypothetical protein